MKAILPTTAGKERLAVLYVLANQLEGTFPRQALEFGLEGAALARQLGDMASEATLYSSMAFSSSEIGDFAQSLRYGYQSLELATQLGDKKRIASANSTLGITYVYVGEFSKALEHHLEALRLREELGLDIAAATTLNNIGIVYHNIGQYDTAIEFYQRSRDRHGPNLSKMGKVRLLTNIGFSEYKRGDFDKALQLHTEALALAESSKYIGVLAYIYLSLGTIAADKGDNSKALDYLHRSLRHYEELGQKFGMVQLLNALGTTYAKDRKFAESLHYLDRAVTLGKQIHAPDQLKTSYEALFSLYEQTGPQAKAFRYFRLYSAAKDSLLNSKESAKIAEVTMQFAILAKQREIEFLKKEALISKLNLEQQNFRFRLIVGGSIVLFLIIYILFILIRRTRMSKVLVDQKNEELKLLNTELQKRIGEIRALSGLLPICASCKKIRDENGKWEHMEGYIAKHSEAKFSHGICPDCAKELYPSLSGSRENRRE